MSTCTGPTTGRRASRTVVSSRGQRPFVVQAAGEFAYTMVDLGVAITFFVGTVVLLSVGLGLSVIWAGVPLLAAGLLFARFGGTVQRGMARTLLDFPVAGPGGIVQRRPGRGVGSSACSPTASAGAPRGIT